MLPEVSTRNTRFVGFFWNGGGFSAWMPTRSSVVLRPNAFGAAASETANGCSASAAGAGYA
jgi:hypothetical protein